MWCSKPQRRTYLTVTAFLGACTIAGLCLAAEIPQPQEKQWAPTTLALLDYNRDLCDSIAGRVVGHWRSLGESPAAEAKVRDFLVKQALSDLAAGRAAADIIDGFLPQAQQETDRETGASLQRLHKMGKELCDKVAVPIAPRATFETDIANILDLIEREKLELSRLLVVPEEDLQALLEPYLTPIQLAGFEAENEYLDYLESLKPKPKGPTQQELMVAWHKRYIQAVRPTKQALKSYFVARKANDHRNMAAACRDLSGAVIPLLRKREIFKIPVPAVPASRGFELKLFQPLENGYKEIRALAKNCSAGKSREVIDHLQGMNKELNTAGAYLQRFGLKP